RRFHLIVRDDDTADAILTRLNSVHCRPFFVKQIRGDRHRNNGYLPVIRAYRVGPELVAWTDGKNLRELGIYRQTGCYIERIRRN
ncbi:hypothetical protein MJL27_26415, partial [Salmonella enterica subsp. enterica serovar Anatum]|nr:hypothetical protein [Salmonella enterica subsp. enterica serovar Anatum]